MVRGRASLGPDCVLGRASASGYSVKFRLPIVASAQHGHNKRKCRSKSVLCRRDFSGLLIQSRVCGKGCGASVPNGDGPQHDRVTEILVGLRRAGLGASRRLSRRARRRLRGRRSGGGRRRPQVHLVIQHLRDLGLRLPRHLADRQRSDHPRRPRFQLRHSLCRRLGVEASISGRRRSGRPDAQVEIDWYGGIKPTWNSPLGTMNLDFGVIYYSYPGANPDFARPRRSDYVELKAGYSWSALHPSLVTGTTVYWSPDYTFETGLGVDDRNDGRLDVAASSTSSRRSSTACSAGRRAIATTATSSTSTAPTTSITTGTPVWRSPSRSSPSTSATGIRNIGGDAGEHLRRAEALRRALRVLRQGRAALSRRVGQI